MGGNFRNTQLCKRTKSTNSPVLRTNPNDCVWTSKIIIEKHELIDTCLTTAGHYQQRQWRQQQPQKKVISS